MGGEWSFAADRTNGCDADKVTKSSDGFSAGWQPEPDIGFTDLPKRSIDDQNNLVLLLTVLDLNI